MAAEVTRRHQKLHIAAEDPPPFLYAWTHGPEREKAKVEREISKVCSSNPTEKEIGYASKETSFWTKARRKARQI